ncbi:MAG: MBL fold metallo-hydrolase, partial [Rhizobiaceae bacterium]
NIRKTLALGISAVAMVASFVPISPVAAGSLDEASVTYLGGPTYLIEIGDFRIISDPGFDPNGTQRNEGPGHLLTKTMDPPIPVDEIGKIDIALISHAHHLDNLDNEGRRLLGKVGQTFTTPHSASLGLPGTVAGLESWQSVDVTNETGQTMKVTAVPAVHTSNPALKDLVGDVTGFILEWDGKTTDILYITGDTVWVDELEEINKRYPNIDTAILHMGGANVPAMGDNILTMDGKQGAKMVKTFGLERVYPAHFEGWRHFPQGAWFITRDFESEGVTDTLRLLAPGENQEISSASN